MKPHRPGRSTVAALVLYLAACGAGVAQEPLTAAPLRTFDATQLPPDRYTVIGRIWVDSWRSAFVVTTHKDSGAALAELSAEASNRGADALINVTCLNDDRAWFDRGYFCYGLAIKLK